MAEKNYATPIVMAIGQMNFQGNITPLSWYKHLTYETGRNAGKPHLTAITALADMVYWYRPYEIRDEKTGDLLGYGKKFKADKLQKSNSGFQHYGLTKKQGRTAIEYLVQKGIIIKEIRERVILKDGKALNNVQYVELVPEALKEITYELTPYALQGTAPPDIEEPYAPQDTGYAPEDTPWYPPGHTNTENTTETPTEESFKTHGDKKLFADNSLEPYPHNNLNGAWVYYKNSEGQLLEAAVVDVTPKRLRLNIKGVGEKLVNPTGTVYCLNGQGSNLNPVVIGDPAPASLEPKCSPEQRAIFDWLYEAVPVVVMTDDEAKIRHRLAKALAEDDDATPETMGQFEHWFRTVDPYGSGQRTGGTPPPLTLRVVSQNYRKGFKDWLNDNQGVYEAAVVAYEIPIPEPATELTPAESTWQAVQAHLRTMMLKHTFDNLFGGCEVLSLADNVLQLQAEEHNLDFIERQRANVDRAAKYVDESLRVEFV